MFSNYQSVVRVIDCDGNERLYVDGKLANTEGDTVYFVDIINAITNKPALLAGQSLDVKESAVVWDENDLEQNWPSTLEELYRRLEELKANTKTTA